MTNSLLRQIRAAGRREPADLVIKNGQIVNVFSRKIQQADIAIVDGMIVGIGSYEGNNVYDAAGCYILPGLIDGHVHIESSLLPPHEFAKVSLLHGVTTAVTDPHEIANVAGQTGIRYMISDAEAVPMNIFTMLPSSVPVTTFETSGAKLTADDLLTFMSETSVLGLAEVMNYQAVADTDEETIAKISRIRAAGGVIDGHAAGIAAADLAVYPVAGIRTDHEAVSSEEARARLDLGLYLMIREGTVAKDLQALLPAVTEATARRCLFVTDDKLIDDLTTEGSIDHCLRLAVKQGLDPLLAIQMATLNAAECFGLKTLGAVAPGYQADFFLTEELSTFKATDVFIKGQQVVAAGQLRDDLFPTHNSNPFLAELPPMNAHPMTEEQFRLPLKKDDVKIIRIIPNSLITEQLQTRVPVKNGCFQPSIKDDLLKIAVIERHHQTGNIGLGIVKGFQLQTGALATSVSHDSHNIVVVGTNDADMQFAAARLLELGGGMIAVENGKELACLPLAIGGLMSELSYQETAEKLRKLKSAAATLGVNPAFDPYLTLSFLTLSVIPELKITDKGLFSFTDFSLTAIEA